MRKDAFDAGATPTVYAGALVWLRSVAENGAAEGIRTPNLQIRSLMLYPVELRPRCASAPEETPRGNGRGH